MIPNKFFITSKFYGNILRLIMIYTVHILHFVLILIGNQNSRGTSMRESVQHQAYHPITIFNSVICSVVVSYPRIACGGSPGIKCISVKTIIKTINKTGITDEIRLSK